MSKERAEADARVSKLLLTFGKNADGLKKSLEKQVADVKADTDEKLKAENERLKSENRALARVVSKLSTAAATLGNRGSSNH